MTTGKKHLSTDFALLLVAVIWALNFSVIKASLSQIDPYSFNAIRFILASCFMWCITAKRKAWFKIRRQDLLPLLVLGLAGNLLYQWLFIIGIDFTFAANAAVMLGTIPIWVALLSHLFSTELMNRLKAAGVFLGFAGVVIIIMAGKNPVSFGSDTFRGDLIILAAAFVWAGYTIFSKNYLARYSPLQFSTLMTTLGAVCLSIIALPHLQDTDWSSVTFSAFGGIFYSGILAIGVAYMLWNNGIHQVGAVRTATYQNLVPVLGLLFGIVLLGESLSTLQYIGSAIVISGILLARYGGNIRFLLHR